MAVELRRCGFKDWFRIGELSVITDPNTTVISNEHIPSIDLRTNQILRFGCAAVLPKELIDGVRIHEVIDWWKFKRVDLSCF